MGRSWQEAGKGLPGVGKALKQARPEMKGQVEAGEAFETPGVEGLVEAR